MTDPDDALPRWRLLQRADALVLGIAALFLAGYLTTVVLQVFVRYVLEYALPWTEEVGVYLFVWSAFMAAAVVVGRNGHFSISLVAGWLGRRQQRALHVLVAVLCLAFSAIMVWKGMAWSWRMLATSSPVLQLPQGAVYAIVPLAGGYMALHLVVRLWELLTRAVTEGGDAGRPC
jgi:TRAP-type C4-dicarboxylate transport system permease small subunit